MKIRSRKWKKEWKHNGQNKEDEKNKQWYKKKNTTQKTEDWIKRNPTKTNGELKCSGRIIISCTTSDTCRFNIERQEHPLMWKSCWTPVSVKNTNNINKTWTHYKTNGNHHIYGTIHASSLVSTVQTLNVLIYSLWAMLRS